MKTIFLSMTMILTTSLVAHTVPTPVEASPIDVRSSSVVWKGYKVTGSHNGTISVKEGKLEFENGMLTGGRVVIDMTSIECKDLEGGAKGKLEGHLKSDDFFGVSNYPTASFEITRVVSRGTEGDYKIIGNLTIKNTTKEIRFLATVKEGRASANIKVDRSQFDVRYGSGSFFDNLGDSTIYDEFDLELNLKY